MGLLTVGLYLLYSAILHGYVLAQDLPEVDDYVDRELALALAKVTWNEASSFAEPADLYLIAQVAENRGNTNAERLAWLRLHSSCVLTDRALEEAERRTNCVWSRGLGWNLEQPENWPTSVLWRERRWALTLRRASQIVRTWRFERPCMGRPMTWGGPMDFSRAAARGLVPHRCVGTLNTGFSTRGDET